MKKRILAILCMICLLAVTACSKGGASESKNQTGDSEPKASTQAADTVKETQPQTETQEPQTESVQESVSESETQTVISDGVAVRVGSLKGPTSMGLVSLMEKNEKGESAQTYQFDMVTAADELVAKISSGAVDIALVPANVASVLYNKTNGGVSVININTLGVLYIVESGDTVKSVSDLKGKTLYMTGKGTTPDYVLSYLLGENGLSAEDVTVEYKSEAAEVAAVLAENADAIGLLPQPFVTVACAQNEQLHIALDLTEEWEKVQGENKSSLVTGVTIVRNDFLTENPDVVAKFQEEAKASVNYTNEQPQEAAVLIENLGIVAKAAIAQKAIPMCNITYIDGAEMKTALSGYLQVLFDKDPTSVGGNMPGEDFYYMAPQGEASEAE